MNLQRRFDIARYAVVKHENNLERIYKLQTDQFAKMITWCKVQSPDWLFQSLNTLMCSSVAPYTKVQI